LIGTDWSISVANSGEQVFTGVDDQILFVISDERVFAGVDDQIPSGYSGEQALAGGDNPQQWARHKKEQQLGKKCLTAALFVSYTIPLALASEPIALRWTSLLRCWR
jgi:hypothetical protein